MYVVETEPSLLDVGEEMLNGKVKCRVYQRRGLSWHGLMVHFRMSNGKVVNEVKYPALTVGDESQICK